MYIYIYVYIYICTYICKYIYIYVCIYINMFVNIYILFVNIYIYTGWWYAYPSEKYESQLGLWKSQYMENKNMFQTTNHIPDAPCMVYLPTFTRTKSPSFVGKYLIHGEKPCSKPPISINKWWCLKMWDPKSPWLSIPTSSDFDDLR